jgi:hypothetical protein
MAELDLSFLRERIARLEASAGREHLASAGGGGPHDPGMEPRVAKLEADVGHIRSDVGDIKTLLGRLAPRIDEMYGRQSSLATQQDIANINVALVQRPTRRQIVFDIFTIVGFIGVLLTIGAKLAH